MAAVMALVILSCFSRTTASRCCHEKKDFVADIIRLTFKNSRCINYVWNQNGVSGYLNAIFLEEVVSPTYSFSFDELLTFNAAVPKCDGFILATDDVGVLKEAFSKKVDSNLMFAPHIPVLVAIGGYESFEEFPFVFAAKIKAVNLIVMQGLNLKDSPLEVGKCENESVLVRSIQHDAMLAFWDGRGAFPARRRVSVDRPWKPTFFIENYTKNFKVSYFHYFPFALHSKERGLYGGIDYKIVEEIARDWPIEFIYNEVNHNLVANIWVKLMNETVSGVTDTNMCGQLVKMILDHGAETLATHTRLCVTFIVPKPKLRTNMTLVFHPFSVALWVLFISMIVLIWVVISIIEYVYMRAGVQTFHGGSSSALYIVRFVTNGSVEIFPSNNHASLSYLYISCCLTFLLLATAYSAGVTISLTYPAYDKSMTTLEDMLDENLLWTHINDYFRNMFAIFPNPTIRALSAKYVQEQSLEMINKRLDTNKFAAIAKLLPEKGILAGSDFFSDHVKTHMRVLTTDCTFMFHIMMPFPRHSPYAKIFNKMIFRFVEHGFIKLWFERIAQDKQYAYMSNFYSANIRQFSHCSMNMDKLQGAFIVLLSGATLSFFVFVVELYRKTTFAPVDN